MHPIRLLFALALFVMPLPALALDCENPLTQVDMNICARQEYERSDRALNAAYGEVMARLSGSEQAQSLLRQAQRAWIAFRDAECDFRTSDSRDGSIYSMLMAGCLADLTDRRAGDLRAVVECPEGETACVLP